jgi:hypothetical protein
MGYFQKYFGTSGALMYYAFGCALLLVCTNHLTRPLYRMNERHSTGLAVGTLFFIMIAFSWVYPIFDSPSRRGGSDREEALNLSATQLLHGRYPYYPKTQLGNPISPLPGAVLLALPFVLLGNSAYQNLFWLTMLYITLKSYFGDGRKALLLCWLVLLFCPIALLDILTGGDFFTNSIYVLILMLYLVRVVPDPTRAISEKLLASALLGLAVSSRANYLLLLPVVFSTLVQHSGWKPAIQYLGLTCLTAGVLTIPFYLYDPAGFSPLHTASKIGRFGSVLPHAEVVVPLAGGILGLALAFQRIHSAAILMGSCVMIQAFLVSCGVVLSSIQSGRLNFGFLGWSTSFTLFGVMVFAPSVLDPIAEPSMKSRQAIFGFRGPSSPVSS